MAPSTINSFLDQFILVIDSGFGLIQGDVAFYDSATKKLDASNSNPAVGHVVAVDGNTVHLKVYGYKLAHS